MWEGTFGHLYSDECAPYGTGLCDGFGPHAVACDCQCHSDYAPYFGTGADSAAWHAELWVDFDPDNYYAPRKISSDSEEW